MIKKKKTYIYIVTTEYSRLQTSRRFHYQSIKYLHKQELSQSWNGEG